MDETTLRLLDDALASARERLMAERCARGHWEGELASSALSTATAAFALSLARRHIARERRGTADLERLIAGGLAWLVRTQNADGGWGDTVRSLSNISTTALCCAALSVPEAKGCGEAVAAAERWLLARAGSLAPEALAKAIGDRYGKDRTFSVPILTMCALAGRLGEGADAWRLIPPLPFELAAFPRQWYRALRFPVVSYALPALIAIGQVGFRRRGSRNPLTGAVRAAAVGPTLRVLRAIQPQGGGFLEATPLTSFVTMSLIGAGHVDHPVAADGVSFLVRSVRPDGSWPIDTDLATWGTTLSVNALAAGDGLGAIGEELREYLIAWLLGQQGQEVHPYTGAAPGGWAWTDLPGGVPDADDTPGALLALHYLAGRAGTPAPPELGGAGRAGTPGPPGRIPTAAAAGVEWLLGLQNADGGMPTFCRGWGTLPFDRSGADLTAHALAAWAAWQPSLDAGLGRRIERARERAVRYLARVQRGDGAWLPLWFGNEHAPREENPVYGTARVLLGLAAAAVNGPMAERGVGYLLGAQGEDGGWGGEVGVTPSLEETSVALHALAATVELGACGREEGEAAMARAVRWLAPRMEGELTPAPIGFYFANLWYFELLYPLVFAVGGLGAARRVLADLA